eukprot:TRINITY_DN28740_c0_g1_i1.p1 TRINITY_DN28740_c0_g1~~TRINITY_DN28740_c0_g1_i1.p1  ORF type:complete len:1780 (+),score=334.12 TRINITY_DN28740_c0_g1_i1:386-5341(+)
MLHITADVMMIDELGKEEGVKTATFQGKMEVGMWGPVVLYDVDNKDDVTGAETTTFVIETRPISARPFSLENARPNDDMSSFAVIMQEALAIREASAARAQLESRSPDNSGSGVRLRKPTWLGNNLLSLVGASRRPEDPISSERSDEALPLALTPSPAAPTTRLTAFDRLTGQSFDSTLWRNSDTSSIKNSSTPSMSDGWPFALTPAWATEMPTHSTEAASWRWLTQIGRSQQDVVAAQDCLRNWVPLDWQLTWHCGKRAEHLHDGAGVVPLMELEFRRDCVILFNTLFPTVGSHSFRELRHLALWDQDCAFRFRRARRPGYRSGARREPRYDGSSEALSEKGFFGVFERALSVVTQRTMNGVRALTPASRASRRSEHDLGMPMRLPLDSREVIGPLGELEQEFASGTTSANSQSMRGMAEPLSSESASGGSQSTLKDTARVESELNVWDCQAEVGKSEGDRPNSLLKPTSSGKKKLVCKGASMAVLTLQEEQAEEEDSGCFSDIPEEGERWPQKVTVAASTEVSQPVAEAIKPPEIQLEEDEADDGNFPSSTERTPRGDLHLGPAEDAMDEQMFDRTNSIRSAPTLTEQENHIALLVKSGRGFLSTTLHKDVSLDMEDDILVDDYSPRVSFLKRLLVCYAECGVYYSEAGNTEQLGDPWPYPIASVLGHGSRVLVRLEDVDSSEFLNFLLSGDPQTVDWKESGIPFPLRTRIAATHSVELTETGQIIEKKLRVTSAAETVQNISDGIRKKHLGLDLPLGGVGHPSPVGSSTYVGFRGEVIRRLPPAHRRASAAPSTVVNIRSDDEILDQEEWKQERRMQGGHLYIRTDDFGIVSSSRALPEFEDQQGITSKSVARSGPGGECAHSRLARLRQQVDTRGTSPAGDLTFPHSVPLLTRRVCRMVERGGQQSGGFRLLRVSSEPDLTTGTVSGTTSEDLAWLGQALVTQHNQPLPTPPSPIALRMLLEHHDPLSARLYGTGTFKTIESFFDELTSGLSILVRSSKGGLQRFCQPVVLQLQHQGRILMKMGECVEGSDAPVAKPSFAVISAGLQESWRKSVSRILKNELCVEDEDAFLETLTETAKRDDCLTILTEYANSPSYPGMPSKYRTHMVCWDVRDEKTAALTESGLFFPPDLMRVEAGTTSSTFSQTLSQYSSTSSERQEKIPFRWHFITLKRRGNKGPLRKAKKLYWRWVPTFEAMKLQRFVNMGEATADERWAKYAFQKEGVVQFPPTETALCILLRRCGIDLHKFGKDGYMSLKDFWLDLTSKESLLQMSGGQPLRLADSTVVRLKWKPYGESAYHVLVRETDKKKRKLLTRRKLNGETWEESAMLCIEEDLSLQPHQSRSLLRPGDKGHYTFMEELTVSNKYPGIKCLYRTHLASFTVKEDTATYVTPRIEFGGHADEVSGATAEQSWIQGKHSSSSRMSRDGRGDSDDMRRRSLEGLEARLRSINYVWVSEKRLQGVKGADLWQRAADQKEKHHICSVLLGLEGTAPQMKSPFGVEHDGSGNKASISAMGNCKWSAYRLNNALQVPADQGGLRMKITRFMFEELRRKCEKLDLQEPSFDLVTEPGASRSREELDERHAEREFFKRILASNAVDAKEAVQWMVSHRAINPTFGNRMRLFDSPAPQEVQANPRQAERAKLRAKHS